MRRLVWIVVCAAALAVPVVVLAGGRGGFEGVVSSIEGTYHVRATRVPMMGLVSLVSRAATKGGVSEIHIAEFEHMPGGVDGEALTQTVETKLGPEWQRTIRETHRARHSPDADNDSGRAEQTLIYTRPEGDRMGLFVMDLDGSEMDVVQVSVDPAHLDESVSRYSHHGGESRTEPD